MGRPQYPAKRTQGVGRLPTPCAWSQCYTIGPGQYCATHKAAALQQARQRARRRPSRRARAAPYGRAWPAIRATQLAHHPRCAHCGTQAAQVDHILPLARGGTHAPVNLQSLCPPCHAAKTARRDGAFGNPIQE